MARKTGLKGLQAWCKQVTEGYPDVEINNMTTSFRDGLAFCAIIHHFRPDLIPFNTLKKGDVQKNNSLAFSVAEKELDIPPLLDVEDMVALAIPDRLSICTYAVQYYNHFKNAQPAVAPGGGNDAAFVPPVKKPKIETVGPTFSSSFQPSAAESSRLHNGPISNRTPPTEPKVPLLPPTVIKPSSTSSPCAPLSKKPFVGTHAPTPPLESKQPLVPPSLPPRGGATCSHGQTTANVTGLVASIQKKEEQQMSSGSSLSHPKPRLTKVVSSPCIPDKPHPPPSIRGGGAKVGGVRGRQEKFTPTVSTISTMEVETAEESPPPQRPPRRKGSSKPSDKNPPGTPTSEQQCDACGDRVFLMQRLSVKGHVYHRSCFQCTRCHATLQSSVFEYDDKADLFFCRQHYREYLRQQSIKRTMASRGIHSFEEADLTSSQKKTKSGSNPPPFVEDLPTASKTPLVVNGVRKVPVPAQPLVTTETKKPSVTTETKKPPVTQAQEEKMKKDLPGLLSNLAQKKQSSSTTPLTVPSFGPVKKPTVDASVTKEQNLPVSSRPTAKPSPPPPWRAAAPRKPPPPITTAAGTANGPTTKPGKTLEEDTGSGLVPTRSVGQWWKEKEKEKRAALSSEPKEPETGRLTQRLSSEASTKRPTLPRLGQKLVPPSTKDSRDVSDTHEPDEVPRYTEPKMVVHDVKKMPPGELEALIAEHYEFPQGDTSASPYEVPLPLPQAKATAPPPKKPPSRRKKFADEKSVESKAAKPQEFVGENRDNVWVRPYATTPLTDSQTKPPRPPPPRPSPISVSTGKKPGTVSPYAVSPTSPRLGESNAELRRMKAQRQRKLEECRRQLASIEKAQNTLEKKGVDLEKQIRSQDDDIELADHLMEEWFTVVHEKNRLVKEEADVVYMIRDLELIEQHDQLENEIRIRLKKDDSLKTELERVEEEAMMDELVELVMMRDRLLWQLDDVKKGEEESDQNIKSFAQVHGMKMNI